MERSNLFMWGGISPPRRRAGFRPAGRVSFPTMGKKPKDRRGTAQDERFALIFALPPVPHYEGRSTGKSSRISGAQNLSGFYRFIPGHWALALQKLMLVRFHLCAWLCRAIAAGANLGGRPKGLPYTDLEGFLNPRRGGACPSRGSLARSVISYRGGTPGPPGVSPPGFQPAV